MGENVIAKRLDRFLVVEDVTSSLYCLRQCVVYGGESNHNPIMLERKGWGRKPPRPLKFNVEWLKDKHFVDLVSNNSIPYCQHRGHAEVQFVNNLRKIKQLTLAWAHEKRC